MLSKITVKNVALIERAEIEFHKGLNVLSGETGAGKSVILDSLNFVLGAKADKTMIRHGETECFVKAEFIVPEESKAVEILREMDVETDGEIIISRKYTLDGKNSLKVNGNTVTAAMLRKATDQLVDVHGQSEHFFLLKESHQLKVLDEGVGEPLKAEKEKLAVVLGELKEVRAQIQKLGGDEKERERRLDVLAFQIEEIEAAALVAGEEEELLIKRNKINNLEKIIAHIREACSALSSDGGALDGLRSAKRSLGVISRLDGAYEAVEERLESLSLEADDIAETLSGLGEELYFDENEAQTVEERLETIKTLKRKYGADVTEITEYLAEIKQEYELLSDCEGQYTRLTQKTDELLNKVYRICQKMTALRKEYGAAFCARVTNELKTLNINSASFEIEFKNYTHEEAEKATENGLDEIVFLFSANAGEPLKPLNKIISGGEMSRFMLAIKTQLSGVNGISTYVFDEIDAGISGKTAKVVGEKFASIAKETQIIAVSHLAQIAAMSDREFLIEKREEDGKTHTQVVALDEKEKVAELVRLLGGEEKDGFAYKHAEELLRQAKEYKNALN